MIGLRFFSLKSADVRGAGTRDEPLRKSAWEAIGKAVIVIIYSLLLSEVILPHNYLFRLKE